MSVANVLQDRAVRWHRELDAYGYVPQPPVRAASVAGELALRAVRPTMYGGPATTADVRELWLPGDDPDGLGLSAFGCFLARSAWHAQIGAPGARYAERLDVDRRKDSSLVVHRHPYGQPNHVRLPATPPAALERWLEEVETLIFHLSSTKTTT